MEEMDIKEELDNDTITIGLTTVIIDIGTIQVILNVIGIAISGAVDLIVVSRSNRQAATE